MRIKKICVLGLGYVGLPTASLLANNGFQVIGVDKEENILKVVNNGGSHIEEPGLKALVHAAVNSGNLKAKDKPEKADAFFIAVPTPVIREEGVVKVNISYVEQAAVDIAACLGKGNLVVLESTSPPGTSKNIVVPILERSGLIAGEDFYLAHCPERILPGNTLRELIQNSRIMGGINDKSAEIAGALYRGFVEGEISLTDATTAEMVKLIENTYRDVNIALANELMLICNKAGVNVWEAVKLANNHPRVNLHLPGPGVGGHCIPLDPWFIISSFKEESKMIAQARAINESRPIAVAEEIVKLVAGINRPVVTILGVSYKGNIDDTRESPALKVIESLAEKGVTIQVYDPHVMHFEYETKSLKDAFAGSDCAVVLADHDEFRFLYPRDLAPLMRTRQVFDTRNCLDRQLWESNGFKTYLLGGN